MNHKAMFMQSYVIERTLTISVNNALPRMPGLTKLTMEYSSCRSFCTGVPVNTTRLCVGKLFTSWSDISSMSFHTAVIFDDGVILTALALMFVWYSQQWFWCWCDTAVVLMLVWYSQHWLWCLYDTHSSGFDVGVIQQWFWCWCDTDSNGFDVGVILTVVVLMLVWYSQ